MSKQPEPDSLADQIGDAVESVVETATESIAKLFDGLAMPRQRKITPGAAPGMRKQDLERMAAESQTRPVTVNCIDYCPDWVKEQKVADFDKFIADNRPEGTTVRWINVDGVSDARMIEKFADKYGLHPLAIEDMMNIPQRPKAEPYEAVGDHQAKLFIVVHMIQKAKGGVRSEQASIFLGDGTLITFLEDPGDVWDPIRQRIRNEGSRLRSNDQSYLLYTLIDAIVDHCFPILEEYSEKLERLEAMVMKGGKPEVVQHIYRVKRDLLLLGRQIWPLRELVNTLMRDEDGHLSEFTQTYMRDVYDHAIQLMEMLEAYRELAGGLADTHLTVMGNRMNEVMKVLTIFATIFIPITFVAGVYGMNFEHIPELHYRWSYAIFWMICISIAVGMLAWFKKRNWL